MSTLSVYKLCFMAALLLLGVSNVGKVQGWFFDQQCALRCFGFECLTNKPAHGELCAGGNQGSCCNNYQQVDNGPASLFSHLSETFSRFNEGWYFAPSCNVFCHVLGCLFKSKPTKEEMCQFPGNRNHQCCETPNANVQLPIGKFLLNIPQEYLVRSTSTRKPSTHRPQLNPYYQQEMQENHTHNPYASWSNDMLEPSEGRSAPMMHQRHPQNATEKRLKSMGLDY